MSSFFSHIFKRNSDHPAMRDLVALTAPYAAPAVHILALDAPSKSHFGGAPRLPVELAWPEKDGRRLDFLARLSLTQIQRELPIPWLPKDGALLFFYDMQEQPWGFDPKDRGSCAVLHVPDLPAAIEPMDHAVCEKESPIEMWDSVRSPSSRHWSAIRSIRLS